MVFVFMASLGVVQQRAAANENWPQWRGPTGNGISDSKNLPTTWSLEKNENIVWKAELPAWSGSTPVVWGDYIFLTSPAKSDGSAPPQNSAGKGPPGKGFGGKGFGGKGFGDKGFGDKGFGDKGFGDKGFGDKGFGDKGFGDKGFGAKGFGDKGFAGRGGGVSRPNDPGGQT